VNFFWTTYIDAVHIVPTVSGGQIVDAFGIPDAEEGYPVGLIPPPNGPLVISTQWQYTVRQQFALFPFGDYVPLQGTELDPGSWAFPLRQDYAERPGWPRSTDHTNSKGRGIAEDKAQEGTSVQASVIASLVDAWNAP